jgi:selenocysteine-specific elongation factor
VSSRCVVVIGHVDHGKTALVRALTGMETDRLPEERARGLSIVPGFAHKQYAGGVIDFIDAPGHEDFVGAMVAGASGADAALLVIAAPEGIAAQTLEHLQIANLLGVEVVAVAVTKCDVPEPATLEATLRDLRATLGQTAAKDAPLFACATLRGDGLAELAAALDALLARPARFAAEGAATLPIDRAFSVAGRGTVVTGTLLGGAMAVGQRAVVQPSGVSVILRGVQSRGTAREVAQPSARVAANLRGIPVAQIPRGAVLTLRDGRAASTCVEVDITALAPLKHMERVRILFGTLSAIATLRLLGGGTLGAGHRGFAQLRFDKPVFGFAGQRAVLRRLSPVGTVAGAVLLDPQAQAWTGSGKTREAVLEAARAGAPKNIAHALCAELRGTAPLSQIARLARQDTPELRRILGTTVQEIAADLIAFTKDIDTSARDIQHALAQYHSDNPLHIDAPRAVLARLRWSQAMISHCIDALIHARLIRRSGSGLRLTAHDPRDHLAPAHAARLQALERAAADGGLQPVPPPTDPLDKDLTALLHDDGVLMTLHNVALDQTLVLHRDALTRAAEILRVAFPVPHLFTTSQARSTLKTSRRIIVPVLEYFDRQGLTQRDADARQMTTLPVSDKAQNC